ncbi:MAG: hypothetical protein QNK11_06005 [Legionella sp.]|nr:hypothetical protein [Legionella sp.]
MQAFTELAREYNLYYSHSLTLQEEAVLAAQAVREETFRTYYHEVAPKLKKDSLMFKYLCKDTNDYHTYEFFVSILGTNFYLMNMTTTIGFRTIFDVLIDWMWSKMLLSRAQAFSDYYSKDEQVKQAVNPEKKLYPILKRWCQAHNIDIEQLNDELSPKYTAKDLEVYAELMLLDLNICALKAPYKIPKTQPTFFQPQTEPLENQGEPVSYSANVKYPV